MKFVLRMAVRETRASWRRLLFFFVCIAVGVAAIVALRSVIQSVRAVFSREAKSLIAADVLISTNRDWTPQVREKIDRRLVDAGRTEQTETVETPTMVRPADPSKRVARMVELKAVQHAFPLYGDIEIDGGRSYSHALLKDHGALVGRELLISLGVGVGGAPVKSLDELAGSTLRVDYTQPGWFAWKVPGPYWSQWVARLEPGPMGRRMPRPAVRERTREGALAVLRRLDPQLRETVPVETSEGNLREEAQRGRAATK